MSESTETPSKTSYQRDQPAGFLEKIGVRYYQHLTQKTGLDSLETLADDLLFYNNDLKKYPQKDWNYRRTNLGFSS